MSLSVQFQSMLVMIALGAWIGAAFDTYGRFFRSGKKRAKWIIFINDVLFWILQGLICFIILFYINQGEIRLYLLLAILCGYAAYKSLLQKIYLTTLEFLINIGKLIKNTIILLVKMFIINPIKWIIHIVIAILLFIYQVIYKIFSFIFKVLKILIRWALRPIWVILPDKIKIFLNKLAGFSDKIKNTIRKLWKRYRR